MVGSGIEGGGGCSWRHHWEAGRGVGCEEARGEGEEEGGTCGVPLNVWRASVLGGKAQSWRFA